MKKTISLKSFLKNSILFFTLIIIMGMIPSAPEEGMFPVTEINKLDLKSAGLKIATEDIFNPNGVGLVDALVRLPGCTGSFVSENGLIVTNHHCAFGAVNKVSTTENNYLKDGFLANSYEEEIPLENYFIRIAESYEDVSDIILKDIDEITDHAERAKEIAKRRNELAEDEADSENAIDAEVSEMFVGKTYVLIKYKILKDVRLVYIPPLAIGNFGGETDNWMWPRHTGDFSFYRAYVAPDGTSAQYSEENVPFSPKRYIKVNPNGVDENDFVFVLGYPARTFRHRPSQYVKFQQEYQLPYIQQLYSWSINLYEKIGAGNPDLELQYATPIKRLANTEKNYRGKLKGLRKLQLVEKKEQQEKILQSFIDANPKLKAVHGDLLTKISDVYKYIFQFGLANLWFGQMEYRSGFYKIADFVITYADQMALAKDKRNENFNEDNLQATINQFRNTVQYFDYPLEKALLVKMLTDATQFDNTERIKGVCELIKESENVEETITDFVNNILVDSQLLNIQYFDALLEKDSEDILNIDDPLFTFVKELDKQNKDIADRNLEARGQMNKLLAQLVDVKSAWRKASFVPDANYSLRFTYGYIRGYNPVDAVHHNPLSTIDGVIEKNLTGNPDYKLPEGYHELYNNKDFGRYYDEKLGSIPTGILYNLDTSGGNSGSPILNAYGELIGLNFDRSFDATINDFAWNESYSRSIGVDIRYILWVAQKFSGAENLVKELGVQL